MSKKNIVADLKRVASILKRCPTRSEYHGRDDNKKFGNFSEHVVKKFFGTYDNLIRESGLVNERTTIVDPDGYKLAQNKAEIERLNSYVRELEDEAMNARSLRKLIGSADTTRIGENAEWLSGPRELKNSITGIPTLFLSDLHFDEVVKAEEINFVNEYNHEIAVQRIKHTFKTAIDLTKLYLFKPKYEGFICALGGDMFSGNIHEELAETNDQAIMRSILDLLDLLATGIGTLADEFGKVFVPCVVGNHGRLHKKPRYKQKIEHNYEWLLYQLLSRHFKNDSRVSFLIPDAPDAQWNCYGRVYNLNHGDQFKGGSGIAGVFSPLMLGMARKQKKQNAIGQPFDVMLNGHWHQYIHTDSLIINGSMKGYDEFANGHNFNYEPPQQALWISHPLKRETFRMPILCDDESKLRKKILSPLSW